jgi:hypothetical protein
MRRGRAVGRGDGSAGRLRRPPVAGHPAIGHRRTADRPRAARVRWWRQAGHRLPRQRHRGDGARDGHDGRRGGGIPALRARGDARGHGRGLLAIDGPGRTHPPRPGPPRPRDSHVEPARTAARRELECERGAGPRGERGHADHRSGGRWGRRGPRGRDGAARDRRRPDDVRDDIRDGRLHGAELGARRPRDGVRHSAAGDRTAAPRSHVVRAQPDAAAGHRVCVVDRPARCWWDPGGPRRRARSPQARCKRARRRR